ncbi:hypothetical protein [Thiohalorhabdus sp.]|uniref:hypothetical protein n=1 Tax=Thiohalorhabdus sp. TaxID=3094134 RepID=UPI002FC2F56D
MANGPHCPVCSMAADPDASTLEYRHMHFAFCSEPCREHFRRNPESYLELRPPPRPSGGVKQRRLRLGQRLTGDESETLRDLLEGMMGITSVEIRGDRVAITYQRDQTSDDRLEEELVEAGDRLGQGWADRLRRAFRHFEEESGG